MQPTEDPTSVNAPVPAASDGSVGVPLPGPMDYIQQPEPTIDPSHFPTTQLSAAGQALDFDQKTQAAAPAQAAPKAPTPPLVNPPSAANDEDLIEQEWVDKAKAIVDRTHDDPHMQNLELGKFKADYIKKRYNREIKVSEE